MAVNFAGKSSAEPTKIPNRVRVLLLSVLAAPVRVCGVRDRLGLLWDDYGFN